jgi:hypothetical protein
VSLIIKKKELKNIESCGNADEKETFQSFTAENFSAVEGHAHISFFFLSPMQGKSANGGRSGGE